MNAVPKEVCIPPHPPPPALSGLPFLVNLALQDGTDLANTLERAFPLMCRMADYLLWDELLFPRSTVQRQWGSTCEPPRAAG